MRNWICAVLLIVGCDEVEPEGDADASVPREAEAIERDGPAADADGLREHVRENMMNAQSDEEIVEGERLLAAIDASVQATIDASDAARSACYSALTGMAPHSLIMVPLPHPTSNLDVACHVAINPGWHAGGVAKGRYFSQDCVAPLENQLYGGGYTAFVPEGYFEANAVFYPSCGPNNAFICCSPQFPN